MADSTFVTSKHHERMNLRELDRKDFREEFLECVAEGLSATPKRLSPKFFYDERGSQLFEEITRAPEYYPTRTEAEILSRFAEDIVRAVGRGLGLVELGSGSSTKTRLLIDALTETQGALTYTPIDVSPTIVIEHGKQLLKDYPLLRINALVCDYRQAMDVLKQPQETPRLFLFLGSSLCNFALEEAASLLSEIGDAMGRQDRLLLGMDLKKDKDVLEAAYNDAAGVTAAFNLNLLSHINDALGGHFDLSLFRHLAFFNEAESRIEMHLESLESQLVRIDALERSVPFRKGETIHTENSYKLDPAALDGLYSGTGLKKTGRWSDDDGWFALDLLAAV